MKIGDKALKAIHAILVSEFNKQLDSRRNGETPNYSEYDIPELIWELEKYSDGVLPKTVYK